MEQNNKYISAYYSDEEELLLGIKQIKKQKIKIVDVLTPFPVHGIDKVIGYRRSWIPRVGFIGGAIGAISGLLFQIWVFTKGYPINFGGKPFLSIPSFIPVTFECAILFAAFAMVFAFFFRSNLGLGAENKIYDSKITDDRFVVVAGLEKDTSEKNIAFIKDNLTKTGAKIIEIIK